MNFRLFKRLWFRNKAPFILPFLLFFSFFSCQDKSPILAIEGQFSNGVLVTNEGQFQAGNASVSFYNALNGAVQEKIFSSINNQPLGDILQSIHINEDKTYLVVNNSSKIEVVNSADFTSISTIEDLGSPRYIQIIDDSKAYVSDLYNGAISIVDLESGEKTGAIPIGGASEEMILIGRELFVTQPSLFDNYSNQLFVINTDSNEITDSITIGYNPSNIQLDKNNQLWVVCNGDRAVTDNLGGVYRINPNTKQVDLALPFKDKAMSFYPRLAMNAQKDQLYFLKLDIYNLPITATNLPTTPIIEAKGRDFYALGIHPNSGQIYVGDSGNFSQKGTVTIHDETGKELSSFKAGVGVNGFYFN